MTNREALLSIIKGFEFDDASIEKYFLDASLIETDLYSDVKAIDLIAIELLQSKLYLASESEGGYSISYSLEGLKALLRFLAYKHGIVIPGIGGTIRAGHLW